MNGLNLILNLPHSVNFRASVSDKDIDDIRNAKQYFSDCYLMASTEALSETANGRKILKERIQYDDNDPDIINCFLYKKDGVLEKYAIPSNEVVKGYEKLYKHQDNKIIRSLDISVGEYENKYKSKPFICRFTDNFKTYSFEYNLPSNYMKMLTGIEPHVVAETDFNFDLSGYKNAVMPLLERMDKEKDFSFVIATGPKMLDGKNWHVYVIEDVNLKEDTITVKEKRFNTPRVMKIDTALNTFKYITGYFNSDLEK